ncbi:MAG: tRNA threonylcarbamoyladenosine dehydratase [Planctomycetia bacterium]|nr:tRNA threonylcarbamoyladenosine dehydratase [Planctomycetia bacterium]
MDETLSENEILPDEPRFSRIRQLVGTEGMAKLHQSKILVVGLGAVGSYAVEGLARAGIGHFRLVDFDVIQPSNINRQLYALESTLGQPKCDVARARVLDISPHCRVESFPLFVHADTMEQLFADFTPDMTVDAIDALEPKVELMCTLQQRQLHAISSLGAALRTDPTQVRISFLRDVQGCPLGRMIKKRMRRRGISREAMRFVCVHSTEDVSDIRTQFLKPPEPLQPGEFHRGRLRNVLGSYPTLTGIFGLTIANYVIQKLLHSKFPV